MINTLTCKNTKQHTGKYHKPGRALSILYTDHFQVSSWGSLSSPVCPPSIRQSAWSRADISGIWIQYCWKNPIKTNWSTCTFLINVDYPFINMRGHTINLTCLKYSEALGIMRDFHSFLTQFTREVFNPILKLQKWNWLWWSLNSL